VLQTMRGRMLLWLLAGAAGVALGRLTDPEVRQRRLDAAALRARHVRLARVQSMLLVSQGYQSDPS